MSNEMLSKEIRGLFKIPGLLEAMDIRASKDVVWNKEKDYRFGFRRNSEGELDSLPWANSWAEYLAVASQVLSEFAEQGDN